MSVTSFISISIFLAFVIGFFVASIIWFISWAISKPEEKIADSEQKTFQSIFKNSKSISTKVRSFDSENQIVNVANGAVNLELYNYYHGKN